MTVAVSLKYSGSRTVCGNDWWSIHPFLLQPSLTFHLLNCIISPSQSLAIHNATCLCGNAGAWKWLSLKAALSLASAASSVQQLSATQSIVLFPNRFNWKQQTTVRLAYWHCLCKNMFFFLLIFSLEFFSVFLQEIYMNRGKMRDETWPGYTFRKYKSSVVLNVCQFNQSCCKICLTSVCTYININIK